SSLRELGSLPPSEPAPRESNLSESMIRVSVKLLDELMNLVGELVIVRNQILPFATARHPASFSGPCQRLNRITLGLQESVMKTRMVPVGPSGANFRV